MPAYARIAVNVPGQSGEYDYRIPSELEGTLQAGHLVTVPFGSQTVQGVILELVPQPSVADTRLLLDLIDPLPVLTASQLDLARSMTAATLNPLAAMLELMIPPGLARQADVLYARSARPEPAGDQRSLIATRLLKLIAARGALSGRQIDRHFARVDWRRTARHLVRSGILESRSFLPAPAVRSKYVRTAQLAVPPEEAQGSMPHLGRTAETLARRQAALRNLIDEPGEADVAWVYAASGCDLADLQELAGRGLILLRETETWRDPLQEVERSLAGTEAPPQLTADQQAAWEAVCAVIQGAEPAPPFLLHGVTGSGKTEIYLRAAAEVIRQGKQAIILVPEIAITPQAVRRFLVRFPGQVGLLHSRLSAGERYDTWRRARLGLLKVIIGPRSALFAPLPQVGLIVADECHDPSYAQTDPPFYNAVEAARIYAGICSAACILGSATPSIVQRYQAQQGELLHLELPRRIHNPQLPPVQVIDMRRELVAGNRGIFSRALSDAIEHILRNEQQAILYLNRRGTATSVFCRDCGYVLRCPRCDSPLVYHTDGSAAPLRCHICGYQRSFPTACPACKGPRLRAYGLGSEKVEAQVKELFPSARTLRWDWETTRRKDAHEIILSHFSAHRADILIGTQMLAKGLDLPLVTLVGIVMADIGLNLPDPFAVERTFNLLTQVSGRTGRSSLGGQVILQTFDPDHYAIQAAAAHDDAAFYKDELEQRRRLGYPPFSRLLRLEYRHADPPKAESEARRLAEELARRIEAGNHSQTSLIGPVPCFHSRIAGAYRWQIVVRGPDPASLVREMKLSGWRIEADPLHLL